MNNSIKGLNSECFFADYYFEHPGIDNLPPIFIKDEPVWECLSRLDKIISSFLVRFPDYSELPEGIEISNRPDFMGGIETVFTVTKTLVMEIDQAFPKWGLFFSRGVVIEPTCVLKPPIFLGPRTEVRQGAYLRGNVITGAHCTLGHTTEVKNSIFLGHCEAGHFAYIGDSILGRYVNLGAGSKLANLPFRTFEEKKQIQFPLLKLKYEDAPILLSRSKLGAILGDGVEIGCNCTLSPGAFIGKDSWIYPCLAIPKGFYSERSVIKPGAAPIIMKKRE